MTSLTYMTRNDWGQNGTAMEAQSKVIREWIGESSCFFAVADSNRINENDQMVDREVLNYLAPAASVRRVRSISELSHLQRDDQLIADLVVIIHPQGERELEAIRTAVEAESLREVFVMLWTSGGPVRQWLDGNCALNLHTGEASAVLDPLMVSAAQMMVAHEYNGLGSGRGKDAVVQLVRAFATQGYPLDVDAWMQAYFAAGGSFRHAEDVSRLIKEMSQGKVHRVKPRYKADIFSIIRDRSSDLGETTSSSYVD